MKKEPRTDGTETDRHFKANIAFKNIGKARVYFKALLIYVARLRLIFQSGVKGKNAGSISDFVYIKKKGHLSVVS